MGDLPEKEVSIWLNILAIAVLMIAFLLSIRFSAKYSKRRKITRGLRTKSTATDHIDVVVVAQSVKSTASDPDQYIPISNFPKLKRVKSSDSMKSMKSSKSSTSIQS